MAAAGTAAEQTPTGTWALWLNWRRKRFWLLAALLAYTLLGFFAAPPLVRWLVTSPIEQSGRVATLEEVKVNPFLMTLLVRGAEIRDTDGTPILSVGEFFVNFQASSLFRWAWTFREMRLLDLSVHEERFRESGTRYTRLIESLSASENSDAGDAPEPGELPRIIVGQFILQDGRVRFTDQVAGGFEGAFGPINIAVDDLRTLPDHHGQHAVSIRTEAGGGIEWRGSLSTVPLASKGRLSINGRVLDDAFRYAAHYLPFEAFGDSLQVDLDYHLGLRDEALFLSVDSLQAEALGLGIRPKDSDAETLRIGTLAVTGGSLQWPERSARIERVGIEQATLRAGRLPDGSIDLLAGVPARTGDEDAAADASPWALALDAIDIDDTAVHLSDATLQPPFELALEPVRVRLREIDNREGTVFPVEVSLQLSTGGTLAYAGTAQALPAPATRGQLQLDGLALSLAQRYLEPFARIELEDGALDMTATVEYGPGQPARLEGALAIERLLIHDTLLDERLLSWDTMRLDRFEADLAAKRLETSKLEFDGLFGRFHIAEDLTTNVSDLVVERPQAEPGDAPAEWPELQIGGIQLERGGLDFSDFSLPLPFRTRIQALTGSISTLSTTSAEPAAVTMEGQVNEFGQARIAGELNPWAPTDLAHIDMTFRNLDLARLSPYTVQFAGYAIDDGRIDLDLAYRLDQRQLNGDNNIVIRDIVLGDKVEHPDAGSLPLRLAIALLTDANGIIDLDLTVEGDLDNPEFGIGSVVLKALGNLITKAVTAPFRLLGSLVGIDADDFGTLSFAAGRADISPPDQEQLLKLSQAMAQRPELIVEIAGVFDPRADTAALQAQAVAALFLERAVELPIGAKELSTDHERRVLESIAAEQLSGLDLAALESEHTLTTGASEKAALDLPAYIAALRARLVAAQAVSTDDLLALAGRRADSVLTALRASAPGAELTAVIAEPREVEAENAREIPLELGVSAGN